MNLSLSRDELLGYVSRQLENFFPDKHDACLASEARVLDTVIDKLSYCFKHVRSPRYNADGNQHLNHLYSDQYVLLLWRLSHELYLNYGKNRTSDKIYYLNKMLHGFDCMYDTGLPDIFLVIHGVGTVLGKAEYADFFVVHQGCTIGNHQGTYPKSGRYLGLGANSAVLGDCHLGDYVSVGSGLAVVKRNVESRKSIYRDAKGEVCVKDQPEGLAQRYFFDIQTADAA